MTASNPIAKRIIDNLEKILIASLLIGILIYFIITGEKELKAGLLYSTVLSLQCLLLLYYLYLTRNLYSIFFIGYIILNIGLFLQNSSKELSQNLILVGELSQFGLGLFFMYKTIKESIKNKDWEMYGTLISLELFFPLYYHYALPGKELLMIYNFALPFVLGIVMFNDNLWDKYNFTEKKILTYILASTLAEVLFLSIKLL